jgi:hypothetical protein
MKITTEQAINSVDTLEKYSILVVAIDRKLYRMVTRVMRELIRVSKDHEQDKNMLMRALGRVDEKGEVRILQEKLEEHGKRLYEYLAEEVFVAIPGKIPLEMFEAANVHPTAIELALLDWVILWDDKDDKDDGFIPSEE